MLPHELQNVVSITINDDEFEVTEAATVTIKSGGSRHDRARDPRGQAAEEVS